MLVEVVDHRVGIRLGEIVHAQQARHVLVGKLEELFAQGNLILADLQVSHQRHFAARFRGSDQHRARFRGNTHQVLLPWRRSGRRPRLYHQQQTLRFPHRSAAICRVAGTRAGYRPRGRLVFRPEGGA
jgi:hypothetical protein